MQRNSRSDSALGRGDGFVRAVFICRARQDHHPFAFTQQWLNHLGLRVIGLVCNDRLPSRILEQHIGNFFKNHRIIEPEFLAKLVLKTLIYQGLYFLIFYNNNISPDFIV